MQADLNEILTGIIENDLLEDRREYSTEDLALAYLLTDAQALRLYNMIQGEFK